MNPKIKPILFVGTSSDAGKSILNTAFCRIFKQDGYTPAPFKAQNMSLNSYSTPEGGEIGRAQAVQAEACGIAPHTDMNPVLLKPTNDQTSQVIVNGKAVGNLSARAYFASSSKKTLFDEAFAAYRRLATQYNPIVLEGAGSISELNLKERDITNMRMGLRTEAVTYLVADIDRGGVFGAVYGSIMLLSPEERALIKGIFINKFRGDVSLFEDGRRILQELTGIPVVGVIPFFRDIAIEEEDSVALELKSRCANSNPDTKKINTAIIHLKRLSNFTDFKSLELDPRFHTYYTNNPTEIEQADLIVIPGSKNTLEDLTELRRNGVADAIVRAHKAGKKVIGICGGFQMLGLRVEDPLHQEGPLEEVVGLGLLPVVTTLEAEKVTRQRRFHFRETAPWCTGYEIHMGHTTPLPNNPSLPVAHLEDGTQDGYFLCENCWGTYLHGILDNTIVRDQLATGFNQTTPEPLDYAQFKEEQYNKLADWVRQHSDLDYIYKTLSEK